MSKRFINAPDQVVPELMQGLSLDASRVTLVDPTSGHAIAIRTSLAARTQPPRVSVVSGGGSGHEPMAAGYVGEGMLAGAVAGGVFASPSVPAIATLLETVAPLSTGILVVVMNYTGDRLNFRKAVDELKKRSPAYPISMVMVGDDIALPGNPEPRGIAGTIFVLKVAGAAADQGRSMQEVVNIAEAAGRCVASFGVALEPCTIPGHAADPARLNHDEIELGMGIHGEPGVEKQMFPQGAMSNLTNDLIDSVCTRIDAALQAKLEQTRACTALAVMVNNLGAVPRAEMLIVRKAVADFLFAKDAPIFNGNRHRVHMFEGPFMTSLQMMGVSISCFMLPSDNGHMEQLLHELTAVRAWDPGFPLLPPNERRVVLAPGLDARRSNIGVDPNRSPGIRLATPQTQVYGARGSPYSYDQPGGSAGLSGLSASTEKYIIAITNALIAAGNELGSLDRKTGDGDMGDTGTCGVHLEMRFYFHKLSQYLMTTGCFLTDVLSVFAVRYLIPLSHFFKTTIVRRGCDRIRADLDHGVYAKAAGNPSQLFKLLATSTGESMGGSSGMLTSVFLDAAADSFKQHPDMSWRTAFAEGTRAVMREGGAKVGDRTLVDALKPASDALEAGRSLSEAARAARVGCESTKSMTSAKFGRSAYVRTSKLLNQADPGAYAVCVILDALQDAAYG